MTFKCKTRKKAIASGLCVSAVCFITNLFLAIVKLIAGIFGAAPALISDAAHSASDLISSAVVFVGIGISGKPPDKKHPYGHARFECIASILLSVILFAAGIGIGDGGIRSIAAGDYRTAASPSDIAIWVAILAIIVKLLLFRYMNVVAKRQSSSALRADAVHQLSDALASLGALFGILAARLGFPIFDPLASVFISLFLFRTAISVFTEATRSLVDRSADAETEAQLRRAVEAVEGVEMIGAFRTRRFGAFLHVEIELLMEGAHTLSSCDRVAETVKTRVRVADESVRECTVLFRPRTDTDSCLRKDA